MTPDRTPRAGTTGGSNPPARLASAAPSTAAPSGPATPMVPPTRSSASSGHQERSGAAPEPTAAALAFLQALIARRASIEIGPERRSLWISRLNPVVKQRDLGTIDGLVAALQAGDRILEQLVVDAMTTNETMFFRDGPVFEAIVTELIPALMERLGTDERFTIWSGACSSGQEVYSLAMLIDTHHPELARSGRIRILASDLSNTMVERTRAGTYSTLEARRGLTDRHLRTYFERDGDTWVIGPRLQRMVLCRQLNLMEPLDPIPRCELVLLRNVLIYFSDQDRLAVLRKVGERVLRPGGALVLGSSELIGSGERHFTTERLSQGMYFRPRS